MRLSVAVVSWNTRELLDQCLQSVYNTLNDIDAEVIVVDNHSHDGSPEMVSSRYPQAQLIQMPQNVGFAAGNNAAYRASSGSYFLLLNSDTIVHPGAFKSMCDFLDEHPDAGAVGCKLLNGDGTLQRSCSPFPTPWTELFDALYLSKLFPGNRLFGAWGMTYSSYERPMEVGFAGGSCLLIRRSAIEETGLLDEGYFMYSEEADLCYRLRKAGWKIYFTPDGVVTHLGGQSSKLDVKRNAVELFKSKHRFIRKHYGRLSALSYRAVVAVSAAVRAAVWSVLSVGGKNRRIYREKTGIQGRIFIWAIKRVRQ